MDAAGARALARRIEEQKALDASLMVPEDASLAAKLDQRTPVHEVEIVPPRGADPAGQRDIRMYSRTLSYETVDGRPAVVTTVRCRALVDGEWRSRIVEVHVKPI